MPQRSRSPSRASSRSGHDRKQEEKRRPNRKNQKQPPQKNIDDFWDAFTTKNPGKIHTILPKNQYAIRKAKHEPRGAVQSQPVLRSFEAAREECKAVVDKISKECRRVNQRYRDQHFDMEFDLKFEIRNCLEKLIPGPNDSPLFPKSVKRVGQIFDDPRFFIDGASPTDVRQGRDGDCWFLSGLSACVQRPGWIEQICVSRDEEVGVYGFVFHRDGEWFHTVIDDRLYLSAADFDESYQEKIAMLQLNNPGDMEEAYRDFYQSGSKALYFATCTTNNETWLPLIEKAYAKAHGDFGSIDGGFTGEAIEDLTGGVTSEVWTSDVLDTNKFWEELQQVNKEFLFSCATGWSDNFNGAAWLTNRKDIYSGHAYVIMEAREIKNVRLLKLRNPWGDSEWKGAWSDGSSEWTPEWMDLLNHRFGDDGVFWISYKDLLRKFSHLDRTRLFADKDWKVSQQWVSVSVPWTKNYIDTKFEFEVKHAGRCVIVLSQLDERYFQGLEGQYYFTLQFRVENDREDSYIVRSNTTYFMNRSCSVELDLEPGVYSVLMKIDAEKTTEKETSEQVTRRLLHQKRDKLLQVGFSYDLAHAKAYSYEEQEREVLSAKERRKKESDQKKERYLQAVRYQKWRIWERKKRELDRTMRHRARYEERGRDRREAPRVRNDEPSSQPDASEPREGATDPDKEDGPQRDTVVQPTQSKSDPPAQDVASEQKTEEENSRETGTGDQRSETISAGSGPSAPLAGPGSSKEQQRPEQQEEAPTVNGKQPLELTEKGKLPQLLLPNGGQLGGTPHPSGLEPESDIASISSWATSVDSVLDGLMSGASLGSAFYEYPDGKRVELDEDDKKVAEDSWNAVCVVGLRIFSKSEVTVRIVRPQNDETSLDLDDVNKAITGEKVVD